MTLTRSQIRAAIRSHRGALLAVAVAAGVKSPTVHKWLKGHMQSANVEQHARAKAQELLSNCGKKGKVSA